MKVDLKDCHCNPTTYSGGSTLMVHSMNCAKYPERPLTREEYQEWRAQVRAIASLHPVLGRRAAVERVYQPSVPKDHWHIEGDGCEWCLEGIPLAKHKSSRRPKAGI